MPFFWTSLLHCQLSSFDKNSIFTFQSRTPSLSLGIFIYLLIIIYSHIEAEKDDSNISIKKNKINEGRFHRGPLSFSINQIPQHYDFCTFIYIQEILFKNDILLSFCASHLLQAENGKRQHTETANLTATRSFFGNISDINTGFTYFLLIKEITLPINSLKNKIY